MVKMTRLHFLYYPINAWPNGKARLAVYFGLCLVLCTITLDCLATTGLVNVFESQLQEDVNEITIELDYPLRLSSRFESDDQLVFKALAVTPLTTAVSDWQFVELAFDEADRVLNKVSLEGSNAKGFTIALHFKKPMVLTTRPQILSNKIDVVAISSGTHSILTAFSDKQNSSFAIKLNTRVYPEPKSFPEKLARNKIIYPDAQEPQDIRIGFFDTETAATVALRGLRGKYPKAKIVAVADSEIKYANLVPLFPLNQLVVAEEDRKGTVKMAAQAHTPGSLDNDVAMIPVPEPQWQEELDRSVLDAAQEAYLDKDWNRAISLYTKASKTAELREEALEKLGVARERNKQLAHAKAVYQEYLDEFPSNEGTSRVRQRLQSLIGSDSGIVKLRKAKRPSADSWRNMAFLAQFYRRHSLDIDGSDKRIPIDALFTDATLSTRKQANGNFHEASVSLGHIQDFSSEADQKSFRLQRAYWESFFDRYNTGFKIGRQSRNKSGVLGRFDGATVSYRQSETIQWNVVGGNLVRSSYGNSGAERTFYGASADIRLLNGKLEFSPFVIQQQYDGVVDRRAVGAQLFWLTDKSLINTLVDYDFYHQALNNFYVTGSYDLTQTWRLNGAVDYRRSPYLTTSNALIGQRFEDLSELERDLIDMKLEDVAEDRTATSTTVRVGLDGTLNSTWHITIDASTSEYSSTNTSAGVFGIPSRTDYTFSTQLRANDILGTNSYSAVQMRFNKSENSSTSTLFFTNRFRLFDDWFVLPRVVASQREFGPDSLEQLRIKPSIRVNYRGFRRFDLEAEVGYDLTTRETTNEDIDTTGVFFRLGYRARF
jgi:tetratricopeptide (TPR) repeat protein